MGSFPSDDPDHQRRCALVASLMATIRELLEQSPHLSRCMVEQTARSTEAAGLQLEHELRMLRAHETWAEVIRRIAEQPRDRFKHTLDRAAHPSETYDPSAVYGPSHGAPSLAQAMVAFGVPSHVRSVEEVAREASAFRKAFAEAAPLARLATAFVVKMHDPSLDYDKFAIVRSTLESMESWRELCSFIAAMSLATIDKLSEET